MPHPEASEAGMLQWCREKYVHIDSANGNPPQSKECFHKYYREYIEIEQENFNGILTHKRRNKDMRQEAAQDCAIRLRLNWIIMYNQTIY